MKPIDIKTVATITLLLLSIRAYPQFQGNQPTVFTVGTDNACDYTVIQDAIDAVPDNSQDDHQIRITRQQNWNENLIIINKDNLLIQASFANCTDAINNTFTSGPATELRGLGSNATGIFIASSEDVDLRRFKVSGFHLGGVAVVGGSIVTMHSMEIRENVRNNTPGGGLYMSNESSVSLSLSKVTMNQANNGAGIYCDSGSLFLRATQVNSNSTNSSTGIGGGMLLDDGCWARPSSFDIFFDPSTFNNNKAHQFGAGVAIINGARFETNSVQNEERIGRVYITGNIIRNPVTNLLNSAGAGIYASGIGSQVILHSTIIANNNFDDQLQFVGGAAIALDNQATLNIQDRGPNQYCIDETSNDRNCSQIKGHYVNNGDAAVIKIQGGAKANIYQTSIFDNQTSTNTNQLASVIDGSLVMQGNLIYDNGTRPNGQFQQPTRLIRVSPNGTFHGDFLTFSDNRLWGGWVIQSFNSNSIKLTRSIVAEDSNESVFNDSTIQPSQTLFDCILTHEDNSINGTDISVIPPQFENTRPYHISANSPAINMCDNNLGDLLPRHDIDGDERGPCSGVCSTDRFDAGADEFTRPDLIFKNSFELLL